MSKDDKCKPEEPWHIRNLNKIGIVLLILAVFICSACASSEPKTDVNDLDLDNAVTENGERLYCKRERVKGTHRVTTTCLTEAEKVAARRNSEEYLNRTQRTAQPKNSEG